MDNIGVHTAIDFTLLAAAQGWMGPEVKPYFKFGEIDAIDASGDYPVWDLDNTDYVWPDNAGETMSVQSSSVNDAVGGSGAEAVLIDGFDVNLSPKTLVFPMNGTTPVNIGVWRRVRRMLVLYRQQQTGTITVENEGGTVFAQIKNGSEPKGQTQMVIDTVPMGWTLHLWDVMLGIGQIREAVKMYFCSKYDATDPEVLADDIPVTGMVPYDTLDALFNTPAGNRGSFIVAGNGLNIPLPRNRVDEGTDYMIRAKNLANQIQNGITCSVAGLLIKNREG